MKVDPSSEVRERGTVMRWFDFEHDSYGFIRLDRPPHDRDVFVHLKQTGARLVPGTRVSCVVSMTARGLRASDVVVETRMRSPRDECGGAGEGAS